MRSRERRTSPPLAAGAITGIRIDSTWENQMKRRDFIASSTAAAGSMLLPLEIFAQVDRRKELLIVANEFGPNSLDIHTVGANRPAYGVSWICYDRPMTFGKKKGPGGVTMYAYTKQKPQ